MPLTIVLADDSMTAQNMGKKILDDAGYNVIAVSNGAAALKKIREVRPDLAILDIYMPGYTGLEVCEKIKQAPETGGIPVLLTVGKLEPYRASDGAMVKAEGVIIKPFEASDLLAAVQQITVAAPPPPVVDDGTIRLDRASIAPVNNAPGYADWQKTSEIQAGDTIQIPPPPPVVDAPAFAVDNALPAVQPEHAPAFDMSAFDTTISIPAPPSPPTKEFAMPSYASEPIAEVAPPPIPAIAAEPSAVSAYALDANLLENELDNLGAPAAEVIEAPAPPPLAVAPSVSYDETIFELPPVDAPISLEAPATETPLAPPPPPPVLDSPYAAVEPSSPWIAEPAGSELPPPPPPPVIDYDLSALPAETPAPNEAATASFELPALELEPMATPAFEPVVEATEPAPPPVIAPPSFAPLDEGELVIDDLPAATPTTWEFAPVEPLVSPDNELLAAPEEPLPAAAPSDVVEVAPEQVILIDEPTSQEVFAAEPPSPIAEPSPLDAIALEPLELDLPEAPIALEEIAAPPAIATPGFSAPPPPEMHFAAPVLDDEPFADLAGLPLEPTILPPSGYEPPIAADPALVTDPTEITNFAVKVGVDEPEDVPVGVADESLLNPSIVSSSSSALEETQPIITVSAADAPTDAVEDFHTEYSPQADGGIDLMIPEASPSSPLMAAAAGAAVGSAIAASVAHAAVAPLGEHVLDPEASANTTPKIGEQLHGLPMDELIGKPLQEACNAQPKLADSTAGFIHNVGFIAGDVELAAAMHAAISQAPVASEPAAVIEPAPVVEPVVAVQVPAAVAPVGNSDAMRVAGAVQRVFDRFKPLIVSEILRELEKGE